MTPTSTTDAKIDLRAAHIARTAIARAYERLGGPPTPNDVSDEVLKILCAEGASVKRIKQFRQAMHAAFAGGFP